MNRRHAIALVTLALAAVYHPLFVGQSRLTRDAGAWVVPARWFLRDALAHGALPQWCPWEGIGFPVAADPLFATFYPPSLATLPLPLAWGTSVYLFLHVLWGALGVHALARLLGARAEAAAVGALTWALSGVVTCEWDGGVRLLPAAWFPWVAAASLCVVRGARAQAPSWCAVASLAACAAMMLLTGEVFVALMGAIFAGGVALGELTDAGAPWSAATARRAAGGFCVAVALAMLASAPSWLPAVALMRSTPRGDAFADASTMGWSMHPALLLDLVLSRATLAALLHDGDAQARALVGPVPLYVSLYAGVTAVALAALAPSRGDRRWRALAALAALGLLLALGHHTPAHRLFVAIARPFARMRSPEKFVLLAQTSLSVLAALGAERVFAGARALRRASVAVACVVAAGILFAATHTGSLGTSVAHGALATAARGALLIAALWALHSRGARWWPAVCLAVLVDLAPASHAEQTWEDASHTASADTIAHRARMAHRTPPVRLWRSPTMDDVRVSWTDASTTSQRRALLRPKFNFDLGVTLLPGYEVGIAAPVDHLARAGQVAPLRLLSVDLALTRSSHPAGMRLLGDVAEGARLFAVEAPLPRAFVAHAVAADQSPQRLSHLVAEDVLTGRVAVLREGLFPELPRQPAPPSPCAIASWAAGDVSLVCDAGRPGVAVLVEQWAEGWRATVDGRDVAVFPADRVAVGARVDAGRHQVRLRYVTPWLRTALALGAAGLVAILALALGPSLLARSRRRPA